MAQVRWFRHRARDTAAFEDQCAWLAAHCSSTAVEELLRIAWRTVGAIVTRVVDDAHGAHGAHDPLDALVRIGIDEVSYKNGHRYLTVIVNHDSGNLVWAAPGRDKETLNSFFDALGMSRCARLREVSAYGRGVDLVGGRLALSNAKLVMDAFPHRGLERGDVAAQAPPWCPFIGQGLWRTRWAAWARPPV